MLDQKQSDSSKPNTVNTDISNVSAETHPEQQITDLFLELNQDTQNEYFNCRKECNTLTEEYILSTSYVYFHLQYIHNKQLIIRKQYLPLNKIRECKIKPADFKFFPDQVEIFLQI